MKSLDYQVYAAIMLTNNWKLIQSNLPLELSGHADKMLAQGKLVRATFMDQNDSVRMSTDIENVLREHTHAVESAVSDRWRKVSESREQRAVEKAVIENSARWKKRMVRLRERLTKVS